IRLGDSGGSRNLTPQQERGISLAATTDVGSSQPGALKQSAGPLTRTDIRLATGARKRTGLGVAVAILGLGAGVAVAIWMVKGGPGAAPVVAAGSASPIAAETSGGGAPAP